MTGRAMARRTSSNALTHVVGTFDNLCIAEASATETPLVGKTLRESCKIREHTNCTVVGVWNRGIFQPATPETIIVDKTSSIHACSMQLVLHTANNQHFILVSDDRHARPL